MNKRQLKKARRSQIRIYTGSGAIPGPFRTMRQAIRLARRYGHRIVFRYEFGWRTIKWSERSTRAPAMWCTSLTLVTKDGTEHRSTDEALRRMGPFDYGKIVR